MSGHVCQMDRGQISWVISDSYDCFMLFEDCGDFIFGKIVGDVCKSSYSI